MAGSRLELQILLEKTTGLDEHHVKFQPPSSFRMTYPFLRYKLEGGKTIDADGQKYVKWRRYTLTLIHPNPDNDIVDKLWDLPNCVFDRMYVSDNLNHYVFTILY